MVNEERIEVKNFLNSTPSIYEPSLWTKFSENEWRLIKGRGSSDRSAAILYPNNWRCDNNHVIFNLAGNDMKWSEFEGEIILTKEAEKHTYYSNVESFDWYIEEVKPTWLLRANMPVVQKKIKAHLFNVKGEKISASKYNISYKLHSVLNNWSSLNDVNILPIGCIDLKIEMDGLIAYDMVYNIGDLNLEYSNCSIARFSFQVSNCGQLDFNVIENELYTWGLYKNIFTIETKNISLRIPKSIKSSLKLGNQKGLYFHLKAGFQGMAILDNEGNFISENQNLSLGNLFGLRLLTSLNVDTTLTLKNTLNPEVKIIKTIKNHSQPLISLRDEIVRLYYLADIMDYENKVVLELREGRNISSYKVSGFSHVLNLSSKNSGTLYTSSEEGISNLFAIPINGLSSDVTPIPLIKNLKDQGFEFPKENVHHKFIVLSEKEDGHQLMPRFVNLIDEFGMVSKEERIESFGKQLSENSFDKPIWGHLLELFNICKSDAYDIPFSTFDQFRSLTLNSKLAARAFLFLGINQEDRDTLLYNDIPEMEKDLGICFHWVNQKDWSSALEECELFFGKDYFPLYGNAGHSIPPWPG